MESTNDFATGVMLGENRNGYGNGGMWGMEWLFALLILPMMWGGNGPFGRNNGDAVTEATLCSTNSFNELKSAVGRGFDQQTQLAFQNQRDLCTGFANTQAAVNQSRFENQQCCCETQRQLLENRYLAEKNAADTNATIVAQVQSVKDMLCQQEAARKDARIWQLELNQAFCGVPRFQPGTVFGSIPAPFFGGFGNWGNNCNSCCGNGNI